MGRKVVLGVVILAIAGCATSGISFGQSTPQVTIRVGGQARTYEYVFAAGDWASRYHLTVIMNFLASAAEPAQMLIAGQVDVAFISPERFVPMVAREPGRYLVVGVTSYGSQRHALVVRRESPYKVIEDLRGKKLAAQIGSGNWQVFQRYLQTKHLSISDFQIVNMVPADMAPALRAGVIDGMLAWEPYVSSAVVNGIGRVLLRFWNLGLLSNDIVTTKQYARLNPGTLTRFLAAWYDAAELMHAHPAEAARMAATFEQKRTGVKVDPLVHEATLKYVGTDPLYIVAHTQDFYTELKETAEDLVGTHHLGAVPNFSGIIDVSYLQRAVALSKEAHR